MARVAVTVYVSCVNPSGAVTRMLMMLEPTDRERADDVAPLATETGVPLLTETVIVELAPCIAVGVTVIELTPLPTLSV